MKIYIATELRCAYRLNGEVLEFADISKGNIFDTDAFDAVDAELVGDETVTFLGKETDFNEVYKIITIALEASD